MTAPRGMLRCGGRLNRSAQDVGSRGPPDPKGKLLSALSGRESGPAVRPANLEDERGLSLFATGSTPVALTRMFYT